MKKVTYIRYHNKINAYLILGIDIGSINYQELSEIFVILPSSPIQGCLSTLSTMDEIPQQQS